MRIGEMNAYVKFRESIFIRSRAMIDFVAILWSRTLAEDGFYLTEFYTVDS